MEKIAERKTIVILCVKSISVIFLIFFLLKGLNPDLYKRTDGLKTGNLITDKLNNRLKKVGYKSKANYILLDDNKEYYFTIDDYFPEMKPYYKEFFYYVAQGDSIFKNKNTNFFVIKHSGKETKFFFK